MVDEQGTHEELLAKKGIYHELVSLQRLHRSEGVSPDKGAEAGEFPEDKQTGSHIKLRRQKSKKETKSKDSLEEKEKELEEEQAEAPTFTRMMAENGPEWMWIVAGTVGSTILGVAMPAFSLLYSQMFEEFGQKGEELRKAGIFWSCMYLVLGGKHCS